MQCRFSSLGKKKNSVNSWLCLTDGPQLLECLIDKHNTKRPVQNSLLNRIDLIEKPAFQKVLQIFDTQYVLGFFQQKFRQYILFSMSEPND